jgi:hypothetical protein
VLQIFCFLVVDENVVFARFAGVEIAGAVWFVICGYGWRLPAIGLSRPVLSISSQPDWSVAMLYTFAKVGLTRTCCHHDKQRTQGRSYAVNL